VSLEEYPIENRYLNSKFPFTGCTRASLCVGYATVGDVPVSLADAANAALHCDGTDVVYCSRWNNVFHPLKSFKIFGKRFRRG
jgi:hypothetical protein